MTFILIAYFDWLLGPQKGQIFEKSVKIFFSETVCFMKLILCIHVSGISFYKRNDFCSSRIRTLVDMATFSFHRLIMGKSENLLFLQSHWRFCRNVYLVVVYVLYYFCPKIPYFYWLLGPQTRKIFINYLSIRGQVYFLH